MEEANIVEIGVYPKDVARRLNALKNIQDKHSSIEAEFREEVLALEKKYLSKYQPLYNQRAEIVIGKVEPTDKQCERSEGDEEEVEEGETAPVKGVPKFWFTAFQHNPVLGEMITDKDEEALFSLVDVKVFYLEGNPGFKLDFFFAENAFFTNNKLTKTYYLTTSPDSKFGDVLFDHAEGTTIDWKTDKDLTITVEIKKQRHKGTNKTRTVKKTVPCDSFFNFFNPVKAPSEEEEMDEEKLEEIEGKIEADYEAGEIIKEKIIPHGIDWFTGKALEYEDDDYEDGAWGGDDDDDDEVDDDDEDEDDDEEDEKPVTKGKGAKGAAAGAAGAGKDGEKPPECKQQ